MHLVAYLEYKSQENPKKVFSSDFECSAVNLRKKCLILKENRIIAAKHCIKVTLLVYSNIVVYIYLFIEAASCESYEQCRVFGIPLRRECGITSSASNEVSDFTLNQIQIDKILSCYYQYIGLYRRLIEDSFFALLEFYGLLKHIHD